MFATPRYDYKPPDPSKWTGFGSHIEIENDFVTDNRPKIHLTVKLAPRKVGPGSWNFSDRNVDDVKDGYVSCEPFQVIETRCVMKLLSSPVPNPKPLRPSPNPVKSSQNQFQRDWG